jgi:hypothetical protein
MQQEQAFAGMRRQQDQRVERRHVEAIEIERLAAGRVLQSRALPRRLRRVEGVQRSPAAVAHRDEPLEAESAQPRHAGGDVEQDLLVDEHRVVAGRAAVLRQHRIAGVEQARHGVVAHEARARVHEHDGGRGSLAGRQPKRRVRRCAVLRGKAEHGARRVGGRVAFELEGKVWVGIAADARHAACECSFASSHRSASIAAMHPLPAADTA